MKKYLNVNNKLGNAIMLNNILKTLVGVNIGSILIIDTQFVKIFVGLFALICLVGYNATSKYIDLNTPGKKLTGIKEEEDERNRTSSL